MSSAGSSAAGAGAAGVRAGEGAAEGAGARMLHARSFKLRFAAQREPGRSNVSAVKPLALPATVTDKFYSGQGERGERGGLGAEGERAARALLRIRDMFGRGPRDKYPAPLTAAHEYGWWAAAGAGSVAGAGARHHIRDSAWLAARMRVLAADDKLKHK